MHCTFKCCDIELFTQYNIFCGTSETRGHVGINLSFVYLSVCLSHFSFTGVTCIT